MAIRLEVVAIRLEAMAIRLEAMTMKLEAMAIRLEAMISRKVAVTLPEFSFCFSKNVLDPELEPISLRNGPRHLRLLARGAPLSTPPWRASGSTVRKHCKYLCFQLFQSSTVTKNHRIYSVFCGCPAKNTAKTNV